jgi:nicotinate phosphoribosyltransferase
MRIMKMKKAKLIEFNAENGINVADFYEYSMALANIQNKYFGLQAVFDLVVRNLPATKVVGQFEDDGIKYDQLAKRPYLVNAGLEQAVAILQEVKGNKQLRDYMEQVMDIKDEKLLEFVENVKFKGDLYAMKEGELFFGQEHQLRLHDTFEAAQVYETLLLTAINPQTNVATTANDIADIVNDKVMLLEGGSRRANDPLGTILNTRAAIIGGFNATSNIAYGLLENKKVGGTHGHSYVMLHPTEYDAFVAQAKTFKNKVCFLLDTYDVESALEKAIKVIEKEKLTNFAFRVDSGDLAEQYFMIINRLEAQGYKRDEYTLVASDDLNAGKVVMLEAKGAHFDKYLMGTFLVCPPKPLAGVYKLAAYYNQEGNLVNRGKFSENPRKATLPGIKQIYRIIGEDNMFKKDVIALEGEDITAYLDQGDIVEPLLMKVMGQGRQIIELTSPEQASEYRMQRLSMLPEKYKTGQEEYPVIISEGVNMAIDKVRLSVEAEKRNIFL